MRALAGCARAAAESTPQIAAARRKKQQIPGFPRDDEFSVDRSADRNVDRNGRRVTEE